MPEGSSALTGMRAGREAGSFRAGKTTKQGNNTNWLLYPASVRLNAQAAKEYVEWEILGISFPDLFIALRKGKHQIPGC